MNLWNQAAAIRDEWLAHGLSTAPADRPTAEAAITELYALIGRARPDVVWAASPAAATHHLPTDDGPVTLCTGGVVSPDAVVTLELADLVHRLRESMDQRIGRTLIPPWRWPATASVAATRPPPDAIAAGMRLDDLIDVGVRDTLARSVRTAVRDPLRQALSSSALRWYAQHDVSWIGHYDTYRRLWPRMFGSDLHHQLDLWAAIARSCGWWWSHDGYCVVSERPLFVHSEVAPGTVHEERRTHNAHGPAIEYADGWGAYTWHGTPVPSWVITDPTVERVMAERNVEVRRCAIERIGWDRYIDQAGLTLVATAPDPGNAGCDLHLYDLPATLWGAAGRVLLAVNGSVERDGHRRRYGLAVPSSFTDPIAAAGWSYGLSADQYALLQRRT